MAPKTVRSAGDGTAPQQTPKKQGQVVTWFIIFVAGFVAGIAFTVYKGKIIGSPSPQTNQAQAVNSDNEQAIRAMEAEVAAHPDDFASWIQLGHLYYDADQPQKAIAAYTKSLSLHEGDANLLTDLGVMYRRANQPEKAIECFDKAIKMDPRHQPARFNKGVVLMYDLRDEKGAIAAWEELLAINPEAKTASGEPVSKLVAKLKADQTQNKK